MLDLILDLKRKKSFKTALLRQLENIDHIKQYYYINDTSWMFCYCRYVGKYPRSYHCQPAIYFIFKKEKKKKQRGQKLIIRVKEYECSLCNTFKFFVDLEFSEVKDNIKKNSVSLNNCDFFDYQVIFGCKKFSKRFVKSKIFQLL